MFNTSDLFNPSTSSNSSGSGFFTSLIHNVTSEIQNATASVESDIEADLNSVLRSIAKDLGLHDFYSVHVLDYCEGFYSPNGTNNKNITHCSNTTSFFTFNATQTLQKELNASHIDITLTDLHWPSAIQDGIDALRLGLNVMFVLYCIGIATTGLALLGSAAGIFLHGRLSTFINIFLSLLAFLALTIASAIVTTAAVKATNIINDHGQAINVNAQRGDSFIALTWTATAFMFLAGVAWVAECCVGRRKQKKIPKQYF